MFLPLLLPRHIGSSHTVLPNIQKNLNTYNTYVATPDNMMSILLDDGVYRHISFRKTRDSGFHFDIHTMPSHLMITGDMGTYTFAQHDHDMLHVFAQYDTVRFFHYADMVHCHAEQGRSTVHQYEYELFKQWLLEDFWETSRDMSTDDTLTWWNTIYPQYLQPYPQENIYNPLAIASSLATLATSRPDSNLTPQYLDIHEVAHQWYTLTDQFMLNVLAIYAGVQVYLDHTRQTGHT